jgi:hypothetical protein
VARAIRVIVVEQNNLEERLKRLEEAAGISSVGGVMDCARLRVEKQFSNGEGI